VTLKNQSATPADHWTFRIDFIRNQKVVFKNIVVFLFFLIYLYAGCSIYSDYGISWDEPQSRMNGEVNLKYVSQQLAPSWSFGKFNNTPDLRDWVDRDYGVAFELPLYLI